MSQADYIVSNGTGASVRSDLNGQLAAIVSNNSGSTEPATMYAYQWWADTTTGLLKLRNSANNAWITIRQLDGEFSTVPVENGSAAAPSIFFKDSGTDTGFFSPGADQVAISTGGTSRLAVSTTAVSSTLAVDVPLGAVGTPSITFTGDLNTGVWSPAADTLAASTGGAERARIDSSGRLLVGTTTARRVGVVTAGFELIGDVDKSAISSSVYSNDSAGPYLSLGKSRGVSDGSYTIVTANDQLGNITFAGADGSTLNSIGASITANVDGTPGANDMPGRLSFHTTPDGSASPTERMRIVNGGTIRIACSNFGAAPSASNQGIELGNTNSGCSFAGAGTGTESHLLFFNTNGLIGSIQTNGSATAYNTSSDYRLKENVMPIVDGISRLQQLKPIYFNFIADSTKIVDGFIAHEVQDIVPEAITGKKDAVDDDGNPKHQGIDQSKLVPLLTAALQEAVAKIESLEARLTAAGIE